MLRFPTRLILNFLQASRFENVTGRRNKIVLESFMEVVVVSK